MTEAYTNYERVNRYSGHKRNIILTFPNIAGYNTSDLWLFNLQTSENSLRVFGLKSAYGQGDHISRAHVPHKRSLQV